VNWSGSEQIQARVLYSPDKPGIKQVKWSGSELIENIPPTTVVLI
jgi:hypothetical protein